MLSIALVAAVQFAIVSVVGLAVLALIPARRAQGLLPAAPVIGAAYLVVSLSLVGFVLPVRVAAWIVVPGIIVAAVVVRARRRPGYLPKAKEWWSWAAVTVVGAAAAIIAALPSIYARTALVVQPTVNNDAFFYVEVTRWLLDHPMFQVPDIGSSPATSADSPAFGPYDWSVTTGLRVGQGLVRAATSGLTGIDPSAGFSPVLGVWVLLVPAGAWLLGRAFRMPEAGRILLGAVLATSYSLTFQVLNQNGDSLLGMSFLLAAIGLVTMTMNDRVDRPPYWLAALVLTALAGTYTEFGPFVGAVLAGILLVRNWRRYPVALRAAGVVLALSLLIGPVIWFRAIKSLVFVGGLATGGGSNVTTISDLVISFLGPYASVWRGSDPANLGFISRAALIALVVAVAIGVALACVDRRTRGFAAGVIMGALIAVVVLLRSGDYIGGRAVDMLTPLVLAAAVMGWWTVPGRLRHAPKRWPAVVASSIAIVVCVGLVAVGARASILTINALVPSHRIVTPAYSGAAACATPYAGSAGSDLTVATTTLFDQLWLSDALTGLPDVAYPNLRGDLGYWTIVPNTSFWDGEGDPYVLVGPGAFSAADSARVMCSSGPFELVDMRGGAIVAVPMVDDHNWFWVADAEGGIPSSGTGDVLLLTDRSSLGGASLVVTDVAAGTTISVSQSGSTLHEAQADASGRVVLPLDGATTSGPGAEVTLSADSTFTLAGIDVR